MRPRLLGALLIVALTASCSMRSCGLNDSVLDFGSTSVSSIGDGEYRYGATIDDKMTWWVVNFADVENTPDWPAGKEPPLPISKAIELATRDVVKYTTMPDAYRLDKVEWLHIGNYMNDAQKWIYLVTFERQCAYRGQTFSARGTLTIPVLLDGRVIQGHAE